MADNPAEWDIPSSHLLKISTNLQTFCRNFSAIRRNVYQSAPVFGLPVAPRWKLIEAPFRSRQGPWLAVVDLRGDIERTAETFEYCLRNMVRFVSVLQ